MTHPLFGVQHEAFRAKLRAFVGREILPFVDGWEERGEFPRGLFVKMGEEGYLGLSYPESCGGAGADFTTLIVLAEELARCNSAGVASAIFAHSVMACMPVHQLGTEEQKRRYLLPGIRGEKIGALAITEPEAGSDAGAVRTTAVRDGDDFVLTGTKTFITNGAAADFAIVLASTDPEAGHLGLSLFIVDSGASGFSVRKVLKKMGHHPAGTAELGFDGVRVPASALLGREGRGFHRVLRNFAQERLVIAARNVESAQQVFGWALQRAKKRKAFGKPIGGFQAVSHRLAEMATEVEACRQLVYATVVKLETGARCDKEIAMCKYFTGEMANRVCYGATQIFGGSGYMSESPVERAYRDARAATVTGGTTEIMKELIRRELGL